MTWMQGTKKFAGNRLLHRGTGLVAAAAVIAGSVVGMATPAMAADTTPPPAPQRLVLSPTGTTTDGTVVLTWEHATADDVAYYQVFRTKNTSPAADELTYLGRTEERTNFFIDEAPSEGSFRYAVMAVDSSGNASPTSAWSAIAVDFAENGSGKLEPDNTAPGSVTNLSGGDALTADRTVEMSWTGVTAPDLWRYLVYRANGTGAPKMVGYVDPDYDTFTDVLTADGDYRYHVIAQDHTGNAGPAPTAVRIGVDTTAPGIAITAPVNGKSYASNTSLTIAATITDAVAGYEAADVAYFLDDELLTSRTIQLSTLEAGAHTVTVEVTDKAGNTGTATATFVVGSTSTSPNAPQHLTAPEYSKSRSVTIDWSEPLSGTVGIYKVYRSVSGQQPVMVGATVPATTTWTDAAPADGTYTYYVVAENGTAVSPRSNPAVVTVDTVAPVVSVTAPKSGAAYKPEGTLAPQVTVTDAASGYESDEVIYSLNGKEFTGAINLANLSEGSHTFKVEATDRAGNTATKSVTFKVSATAGGEEPEEPENDDFITLLESLRPQIHHGHFSALMAKARSGQYSNVVKHVLQHRGKFISPEAADKILKALGATNVDPSKLTDYDDDRDDDDRFSGSKGKGQGNSKGKGRK
jgi:fibronectin type 3 domain-containing protein